MDISAWKMVSWNDVLSAVKDDALERLFQTFQYREIEDVWSGMYKLLLEEYPLIGNSSKFLPGGLCRFRVFGTSFNQETIELMVEHCEKERYKWQQPVNISMNLNNDLRLSCCYQDTPLQISVMALAVREKNFNLLKKLLQAGLYHESAGLPCHPLIALYGWKDYEMIEFFIKNSASKSWIKTLKFPTPDGKNMLEYAHEDEDLRTILENTGVMKKEPLNNNINHNINNNRDDISSSLNAFLSLSIALRLIEKNKSYTKEDIVDILEAKENVDKIIQERQIESQKGDIYQTLTGEAPAQNADAAFISNAICSYLLAENGLKTARQKFPQGLKPLVLCMDKNNIMKVYVQLRADLTAQEKAVCEEVVRSKNIDLMKQKQEGRE